jgi:hypothetical protein
MKDRKGPIGRATGLAEGMANTMRRIARDREPRVLVYDSAGYARLVQPDARGYDRILEVSEQMLALTAGEGSLLRRRSGGDGA